MADWSNLITDVLGLIASKLELSDYHRFGAVCRNWQSVAREKLYPPAKQLPWLILGEDAKTKKRVFFSLSENKHYYIDIPELYGHVCVGSSFGWLITVDKEIDTHLLNPFTHEHYGLPPLPDSRGYPTLSEAKALTGKKRYRMQCDLVHKAILSNDPSKSQNFTLVIIFGFPSTLAFWRPGDPKWLVAECPHSSIQDVTYFRGNLYALAGCYELDIVDLGPSPRIKQIDPFVGGINWPKEGYLVDFAGQFLLQIQRAEAIPDDFRDLCDMEEEERRVWEESHMNDDYDEDEDRHFVTEELGVFELDIEAQKSYEWCDIDGSAFFVGRGSFVVVDPSQVPGCVLNRISYTGIMIDYNGFDNTGSYDMVSKNVGEYNPSKAFIPHAVSPSWFNPNPW